MRAAFLSIVLASVLAALALPSAEPEPAAELEKRTIYYGTGTWFNTDNGFGACGPQEHDTSYIVALPTSKFNNGAHCGRPVTINGNGQSVLVTVNDECPGCGDDGLDMTPSVFENFAPLSQGTVGISWYFD